MPATIPPMSEYLILNQWNTMAAAVDYARDLIKHGHWFPADAANEAATILGLPGEKVLERI